MNAVVTVPYLGTIFQFGNSTTWMLYSITHITSLGGRKFSVQVDQL